MSSPEGRKGKRLSISRLLGNKKEKEAQHSRNPSEGLGPPTAASDSAYASSENEPKTSLTPVENTGQISGVSSDRNLGLNKGTGDIVDTESGQVVSTVTTTTTTVSETFGVTETSTDRRFGRQQRQRPRQTKMESRPLKFQRPAASLGRRIYKRCRPIRSNKVVATLAMYRRKRQTQHNLRRRTV